MRDLQEHPERRRVIELVGEGKSDEVKIMQGPAGLHRTGVIGEEPLAEDAFVRVEEAVHGLEPEVRHAHPVRVGIDQGEVQLPAGVFAYGSRLIQHRFRGS